MASVGAAAARSLFRSSSTRSAAARFASQAKSTRTSFCAPTRNPISCSFRSPVELSFCLESMLPHHTATAAALMTSKLSISGNSHGWLLEAYNDDV